MACNLWILQTLINWWFHLTKSSRATYNGFYATTKALPNNIKDPSLCPNFVTQVHACPYMPSETWASLIWNHFLKPVLHFWSLKFRIDFILAFYILKFSFWHLMFDSIFILAFYVLKFSFCLFLFDSIFLFDPHISKFSFWSFMKILKCEGPNKKLNQI